MPQPAFFIHIPKTAGTTLNTILDANLPSDKILNLYTDDQQRRLADITYEQIATYSLVRGHIFIKDYGELLDGPVPFRLFTFLRDPIKRVVSEYFFLKSWPKSHLYEYLNTKKVSLSEYVASESRELRQRGRNGMVNALSGIGGATAEDRFDQAWHHVKDRFVFFGILERFDESLLMLKRILGLESTFYERQNVQAQRPERIVTPEDLEIIREHNQLDIRFYDLAVAEFDTRVKALGPAFSTELRLFSKVNERFQRVSELVNRKVGLEHGDLINSK